MLKKKKNVESDITGKFVMDIKRIPSTIKEVRVVSYCCEQMKEALEPDTFDHPISRWEDKISIGYGAQIKYCPYCGARLSASD